MPKSFTSSAGSRDKKLQYKHCKNKQKPKAYDKKINTNSKLTKLSVQNTNTKKQLGHIIILTINKSLSHNYLYIFMYFCFVLIFFVN